MNTTERPGVVALVTDALGRSADLIQTGFAWPVSRSAKRPTRCAPASSAVSS